MDINQLYTLYLECNQTVSTDSRNCPKGCLFIALKGDNFDGNKYAESALSNGAKYALIDNIDYQLNEYFILVDDSLKALQTLANYHRKALNTPIIGITGTNGKTTTKELIAAVLSQKFNIQYTKGNLNNHIGVPLTLLSIRKEHKIAIVEMGANHIGEIKFLTNMVEPNFGVITNVGKAHLEGFGSFEGVIKTKTELYDYLKKNDNTVVFVDKDNDILYEKAQGIEKLRTYGTTSDADICAVADTSTFTLSFSWGKKGDIPTYEVTTQLVGNYNLPNALVAISIGDYWGIEPHDIDSALNLYAPSNNRSQAKKTAYNDLVIDAYNANPTSMMAALTNFIKIDSPNKVAILGDMRELGKESLLEHQKVVDYLATQHTIEQIILVGNEFGSTKHSFKHFNNIEELKNEVMNTPLHNKTILIKGSNGIKLYEIVDVL